MAAPLYRLLDHTADLAFEVEAATWADLLVAAAAALGDVIRHDEEPWAEERPVAVEGADREDVLVAWLGEALYLYEHEGFLVRGARVASADATGARGAFLGRLTSPENEPPDRVAKAVTYHALRIEEGAPGRPWRTAVVLDL